MGKAPDSTNEARDQRRLGRCQPRYGFMLNPFPEARLSRCPRCEKLTYPRMFPLLIQVDGWGLYIQRKTCKFCSRCELIMCQQVELEEQLIHAFDHRAPNVVGNDYLVMGTVDSKTWKAGTEGGDIGVDAVLGHAADFKKYYDLQYDPGGWRPAGAPPRYLEPTPPPTSWRLARASRSDAGRSNS